MADWKPFRYAVHAGEVPKLCPAILYMRMQMEGRAMPSRYFAERLGFTRAGGRCWRSPKHCHNFMQSLHWLRGAGLAVKLPHEGAGSDAVYQACRGRRDGIRLQMDATERLLVDVRAVGATKTRVRRLEQALSGLRELAGLAE